MQTNEKQMKANLDLFDGVMRVRDEVQIDITVG